jgi:hypothetical protein
MVPRTYMECSDGVRPRLLNSPNFPRTELAGYANREEPYLRLLACQNPTADPDLIDALTEITPPRRRTTRIKRRDPLAHRGPRRAEPRNAAADR